MAHFSSLEYLCAISGMSGGTLLDEAMNNNISLPPSLPRSFTLSVCPFVHSCLFVCLFWSRVWSQGSGGISAGEWSQCEHS